MIEAPTVAKQAQLTAQDWMSEAVCYVEDAFPDYPPEAQAMLIAALTTAAASDKIAVYLRVHAEGTSDASHNLSRSISGLHDVLRSDHPLMGQTLDGVAAGLKAIAKAIQMHRPWDN